MPWRDKESWQTPGPITACRLSPFQSMWWQTWRPQRCVWHLVLGKHKVHKTMTVSLAAPATLSLKENQFHDQHTRSNHRSSCQMFIFVPCVLNLSGQDNTRSILWSTKLKSAFPEVVLTPFDILLVILSAKTLDNFCHLLESLKRRIIFALGLRWVTCACFRGV